MKYLKLFFLILPFFGFGQQIISKDVYNFWNAYDKIIREKDSANQINLIKTLYIDKATPGLAAIMEARRYSAEEYIFAINHYPKFWNSVRENTLKSNTFSKEIEQGVEKLKAIYPQLKPVNTYFEIGILRTGGTIQDGKLLIGSEVALTDKSVITEEFDKRYPYLRSYFDTDPINDVIFLNIHEYIHTQQKGTFGNSLLSQTIMEGVAEFLAEIALNQKSPNPQIDFGFKNEEKIIQEYKKEMFSTNLSNWFWNSPDNQFGMRDLGYFVGYAICKKYYEQSKDKKTAVKEMIQLDYNNENELIKFVEKTKYFPRKLNFYKKVFEKKQPKVLSISQIENGSKNVKSGVIQYSINFSQEMDTNFRGFDYGPLGEQAIYKFKKLIGWSNNNKTLTIEIEVAPNKKYQVTIQGKGGFRNKDGVFAKPYLFEFETGAE